MSGARTHYETLGVAPNATAEQIRRAYRDLARKLHPDVNPAADAQARFTEVQRAYDVLSDRTERARYDRELDEGRRRAGGWQPEGGGASVGRPHYSWRNVGRDATPPKQGGKGSQGGGRGVAGEGGERAGGAGGNAGSGRTELDEMYDAFFGGPLEGRREA